MWLTSISIRRPVFILMIVSALIVLGITGISRMKAELNPRVDFPIITITTSYPGAGPEEIESLITKPIEDAVASVDGVKHINSTSQDGISSITVQFHLNTNINSAATEVQQKVAAIRNQLPQDALPSSIDRLDVNSMPVLYYGLVGNMSSKKLRDLADNTILDYISQVPGVAAVTVTGGDIRDIAVELDENRLNAYGLTIPQVVNALAANNINLACGHEIEGKRQYDVRVIGEFPNVQTIAKTRIPLTDAAVVGSAVPAVKLSDIATVSDSVEERDDITRIQRQDSVGIVIQKTSDANTIDVVNGVKAAVKQLKKILPPGIHFIVSQDQSINVTDNLVDVRNSLFLGVLLAAAVVFLFLHNFRGTMIVAIAIPTSILATFLPMFMFGFTLNSMTLMALSLSVGILVDDSIVVLENIYRHLKMGEDPVEAAINGRSEIGLAAITITMVDVVVFLPIAFMGGIIGQFFRQFGITVACATLFSLFMSFTLTPMLASRWYRAHEKLESERGVFGLFDRFYSGLDRAYERALAWALQYRGFVIYVGSGILVVIFVAIIGSIMGPTFASTKVIASLLFLTVIFGVFFLRHYRLLGLITLGSAIALMLLVLVVATHLPRPLLMFRFAPNQDQGQVGITIEMPAGSSIERADLVTKHIENIVAQNPNVANIFTNVGATAAGFRGGASIGPQYSTISIQLKPKESLIDDINPFASKKGLRKVSDTTVAAQLRKAIGQIPDANIKVAEVSGFSGASAPIQYNLSGQNLKQLTKLADETEAAIATVPGIINPDISWRQGRPEMQITLDRTKAASFGLSVQAISQVVSDAINGDDNVKYRENGNEYPILVQLRQRERQNVQDIGNLVVGMANGQPIRLSDVAQVNLGLGPTKIDRLDHQRVIAVTANLKPGYSPGNMQIAINRVLKKINYGTVQLSVGGENQTQAEESGYMFSALFLSIILVYMLMAALFDNLLYPLVIMISLPQALIGALLALIIVGQALSIISFIGLIMLVGLVTKNAILLVDYTNTLRARGLSRNDALRQAGPVRLRPILMTTGAMVFGMLPTALALGRGAAFRAPLAVAVIGGLILSTMLTLLVIPCVYTYFDDLGRLIGRLIYGRRVVARPATEEAPVD